MKDLLAKKSQKVRKEIEMKLLIEIPTEFESHFNLDCFKDSLKRLEFDANYLAGNYEKELAEMLIESFQNALPVEPEREHGEWVLGGYDDMYYVCNKCGHKQSEYYSKPTANFCPDCGADMRGEQDG